MGFLGGKKNLEGYSQLCAEESSAIYTFSRCLNRKKMNEWKSKVNCSLGKDLVSLYVTKKIKDKC